MEGFRPRRGCRELQFDTVASFSADMCRTVVGSQRAPWAKVCQTCIDVWQRCLGGADGRLYECLMTVPTQQKVYKYVSAEKISTCSQMFTLYRKSATSWMDSSELYTFVVLGGIRIKCHRQVTLTCWCDFCFSVEDLDFKIIVFVLQHKTVLILKW